MTPERWQQLKELLAPALDLVASQRSAYVEQVCVRDPSLRSDLERLLAADAGGGADFLSVPPFEDLVDPHDIGSLIGARVGPYQITQEIGSGGMGEVYRAIRMDEQFHQEVAIKLVRSGHDSKTVVRRFRNERQILAGLHHPNIARLLDGGTTEDGVPYFVMELIEGSPITQYCDSQKLTITERLNLFLHVCSAVQFAHQHLIIHLDIKPGNILVTSDGVPKLLDFGIAKILDPPETETQPQGTLTILRMMTPGYASPEQVAGMTITTTSDIYSLGVVLYELLTGCSPYRLTGRGPHEVARAVCEVEPERPSTAFRRIRTERLGNDCLRPSAIDLAELRHTSPDKLITRLGGDLDAIVLMALRKEPQRRYASVEQLSQDIQRHWGNLPVTARRDSTRYRISKFVARHKAGVAAGVAVIFALMLGMIATFREARIASAERIRAERRFNDVRDLSNSLLFDIHDRIRDLPGATAARKLIVDRAVQYLDGLAQEAGGDPSLQREVAAAYERLGDVQGKPLASSLGDDAEAARSYHKSLVLRESLARTHQANLDDAISLARIHRLIANAAVETGDISAALEHAKRAVDITTTITNSSMGGNPSAASELSWDYMALGCVESGGGFNSAGLSNVPAAVADFDKALAITSQLLNNDPDNVSLAYQNAGLYERIGGLQGMHSHRSEGLQNLNTALKIFQSIGNRNANGSISVQGNVAAVASLIGELQVMDGRFRPALVNFRQELTTYKAFADRDPQDLQARVDLSGAYYDVGDVLVKMGKFRDGLLIIRRAIELDKQLISVDSKRGVLRSNLAQHHVAEAEALNDIGDLTEALQTFGKARSLYQSLADQDPQNLDARLNVAATDAKLGAIYVQLARFDDAHETYSRAEQASESAVGRTPPNLQAQYTLADTYSGLGDVAVHFARITTHPMEQVPRWREAILWYQKSLDLWRSIPNRSVISPSEFDAGDPRQVAARLARCQAVLDKVKRSAGS